MVASCVVFVSLNVFCTDVIDEIAAGYMGSYYGHSPLLVALTSTLLGSDEVRASFANRRAAHCSLLLVR